MSRHIIKDYYHNTGFINTQNVLSILEGTGYTTQTPPITIITLWDLIAEKNGQKFLMYVKGDGLFDHPVIDESDRSEMIVLASCLDAIPLLVKYDTKSDSVYCMVNLKTMDWFYYR